MPTQIMSFIIKMQLLLRYTTFLADSSDNAGGLVESTIVTGTTKLLADGGKVIAIIAGGAGILIAGVFFLRAMANETDRARLIKTGVITIVIGISISLISAITAIIAGYYV